MKPVLLRRGYLQALRLQRDARGSTNVEYVILLVTICVVMLASWAFFGDVIRLIIAGS